MQDIEIEPAGSIPFPQIHAVEQDEITNLLTNALNSRWETDEGVLLLTHLKIGIAPIYP